MNWKSIKKNQCKDSAFALILLLLFLYFATFQVLILKIILFLTIIAMIYPEAFKSFAFIWFNLSKVLGLFIPKIVLSVIFYVFVLPLGIIRRVTGKDDMKFEEWKKNNTSVFSDKNHQYVPENLKDPF